ncbi:hypothetical protein DL93DRAFT_2076628 [Clavulina sp. PMI_390]|nr:hypothetical protein DL93DRAFT_2076628 [Clavulina sp. PMI_390]
MSQPAVHAIFYNISPEITTLPSEFFSGAKPTYADHGIRVGKNVMWGPYEPPRPLLGHGTHRYFFQVIALNRKLDGVLPEKKASYAQVLKTVRKEDILGWGQWVAKVERKMAGK